MALTKDPDEVRYYLIDWEPALDGDTITTSTWIVPGGITEDSASNTTTTATIWLSGGTAGSTYQIINRVTTFAGETLEQLLSLRVVSTLNSLVSLDQVKLRLRIETDDDDASLDGYIRAATLAICSGYLKDPSLLSVDSPPEDVDSRVTTAIIMLVGYWYRNPDSDPDKDFEMGYLPKPITAMLYPMRDPALA